MTALLSILVGLCLLRRGPQDLPYSPVLTRNLVLVGFAIDLLYVSLLDVEQPLPRLLFALAMSLGVPWLLLQLRGQTARYAQTVGAIAGTGALFTLLFLPVALWTRQFAALGPGVEPSGEQMLAGWIVLLLLGWRLAVNGHVLRHALDLPRWAGALIAIAWFLVEFSLDRRLFGVAE